LIDTNRQHSPFRSIVFEHAEDSTCAEEGTRSFFADLNLDQIMASVISGRAQYDLEPLFCTPLHDVAAVEYRHEVLRDLEETSVLELVQTFAKTMQEMRELLAQSKKLHYRYQQERWFLEAVGTYCEAVGSLKEGLGALELASRGLVGLGEYLEVYVASDAFAPLSSELLQLRADLAAITYSIYIKGGYVKVSRYDGEPDYSAEVEETFAKFKQGVGKDYRAKFPAYLELDSVEARVLERVARLYPNEFLRLDQYCALHRDFLDPTVGSFDREVQFYLGYLDHIAPLKAAGLPFCYPRVSAASKEVHADDAFDLALAGTLVPSGTDAVLNSFYLEEPERILVVTGPNQGGKTTFARMFGQLHYLASLGYPIPGTDAAVLLPDRVFTHFEREEDPGTLQGKLEDELVRIHEILEVATGDSIIVMNESFTSTTLNDALFLGEQILTRIINLDALCVSVTFIDEFATLGPTTVSMVTTVVPDDPALRTYSIVRRPADGLAYAAAIAEKYGLTYEALRRRITR
jgi:DNA mismatch repair protein MutS